MITDANFHLSAVFGKHVQSDGSQVAPGSPDPINSGYLQAPPGYPHGMLLYNEGVAYSAVEIYTARPVSANTGRLQLDFDLTDLGSFYKDAQINETDTKLCIGGKMFNFSLQRLAKNDAVQISNQVGNWVDSGFTAPLLFNIPQHHKFLYGFDVVTGRYAIQEIEIGGVSYVTPFSLQEATTHLPTTWPDGAYIQLQSCCGPNGGKVRLLYDNVTYTWS